MVVTVDMPATRSSSCSAAARSPSDSTSRSTARSPRSAPPSSARRSATPRPTPPRTARPAGQGPQGHAVRRLSHTAHRDGRLPCTGRRPSSCPRRAAPASSRPLRPPVSGWRSGGTAGWPAARTPAARPRPRSACRPPGAAAPSPSAAGALGSGLGLPNRSRAAWVTAETGFHSAKVCSGPGRVLQRDERVGDERQREDDDERGVVDHLGARHQHPDPGHHPGDRVGEDQQQRRSRASASSTEVWIRQPTTRPVSDMTTRTRTLLTTSVRVRPVSTADGDIGSDRNRSMMPFLMSSARPAPGDGGAEDDGLGEDAGDEELAVALPPAGRRRSRRRRRRRTAART